MPPRISSPSSARSRGSWAYTLLGARRGEGPRRVVARRHRAYPPDPGVARPTVSGAPWQGQTPGVSHRTRHMTVRAGALDTAAPRVPAVGRRRSAEARLGYLMVAPAVLLLILLIAYPFLMSLYMSLTDEYVGTPGRFIGLGNFVYLLHDDVFRQTAINSVLYTVLALLLYALPWGSRLFRGVILLPWVIPTALSTLAWWWMYTPPYSVVNWMLMRLGVISQPILWLSDPAWARIGIIVVNVWRGLPFYAITFLAGLVAIPRELFEAAETDGAGPLVQFRAIILPLLRPILSIVVMYSTVFTIADFEIVFILTRGGPMNMTHLFSTLAFQVGLVSTFIGRGAAITLFIFPVLAVASFFILRLVRAGEEYA